MKKSKPLELWGIEGTDRRMHVTLLSILVCIVIISISISMVFTFYYILYKKALEYGSNHQYEKAIGMLEWVPDKYKETGLHKWRFEDTLLIGEEAYIITYEMDKEGYRDLSASMRRQFFKGGHDFSIEDIRHDFKTLDEIYDEAMN